MAWHTIFYQSISQPASQPINQPTLSFYSNFLSLVLMHISVCFCLFIHSFIIAHLLMGTSKSIRDSIITITIIATANQEVAMIDPTTITAAILCIRLISRNQSYLFIILVSQLVQVKNGEE